MRRYCPICDHDMPQGTFCRNCRSFVKPKTDNGTYYLNRSHTDNAEHNKNCEFHQYETHTDNHTTFSLNENRIEDYDINPQTKRSFVSNFDASRVSTNQNRYTASSAGKTYTAANNSSNKTYSSGKTYTNTGAASSKTTYIPKNKAKKKSVPFFVIIIAIFCIYGSFIASSINDFIRKDKSYNDITIQDNVDYGENSLHIDQSKLEDVIINEILDNPVRNRRNYTLESNSMDVNQYQYYEDDRDVWVLVYAQENFPGAYAVETYGYDKQIVKDVMLEVIYNSELSKYTTMDKDSLGHFFYSVDGAASSYSLGNGHYLVTSYDEEDYCSAYIY